MLFRSLAFTEDKLLRVQEIESSCRRHPIDAWWNLVNSEETLELERELKEIYKSNLPPKLGALVVTSTCQFVCRHCNYSPDYANFNSLLSSDQWMNIIRNLYDGLGIKTFIHAGRSLDDTGIKILKWMRKTFPDIQIGLIDNGISIIPYLNELSNIKPDWIDISIDGMEENHDLQRNRKGGFKETLKTVAYLYDKDITPKINILTCLTTINKGSVLDLIAFMNKKGLKNFFITPVNTYTDYKPFDELRVTGKDFVEFLQSIHTSLHKFEDTWIEIDIYDIKYMGYIKKLYPELWKNLKPEEDHMAWKTFHENNELYINYHPLSLNGIREIIVNSNGDVILPEAIRKGLIPQNDIVGNLLSQKAVEVVEMVINKLDFFVNALKEEKCCIGGEQ